MEKKKERIAIFIDGRNFYHSTKSLERKGFEINLGKLVNDLAGDRELVVVYYYNALLDKEYDLKRYEEHNEFLDGLRKIPKFKVFFLICSTVLAKIKKIIYRYNFLDYTINIFLDYGFKE